MRGSAQLGRCRVVPGAAAAGAVTRNAAARTVAAAKTRVVRIDVMPSPSCARVRPADGLSRRSTAHCGTSCVDDLIEETQQSVIRFNLSVLEPGRSSCGRAQVAGS